MGLGLSWTRHRPRRARRRHVPRGGPTVPVTMCLPQIAKDVKQFYDQALQQAIVDDEANNAKAVVKTFHETVWTRQSWGMGRGRGGAQLDWA